MIGIIEAIWPYIVATATAIFALLKLYFDYKSKKVINADTCISPSDIEKIRKENQLNEDEIEQATKESSFIDNSLRISTLYDELNKVITQTDCVKLLIMKSHNGGGIPKIGNRLYSSVVYELYSKGEYAMKDRWKVQPLEISYIEMLVLLHKSKDLVFNVDDMEQGALKDNYRAQKITFTKMLEIGYSDKEYFYASVIFRKPFKTMTVEEADIIRAASNAIRLIMLPQGNGHKLV